MDAVEKRIESESKELQENYQAWAAVIRAACQSAIIAQHQLEEMPELDSVIFVVRTQTRGVKLSVTRNSVVEIVD